MKRRITLLLTFLTIFVLTACSVSGTTVTGGSSAGQTTGQAAGITLSQSSSASSSTAANTTTTSTAGTAADSAATVIAGNSKTHEDAKDYVYDAASAIAISLNGDAISSQGKGVTVDGSKATITAAGTYSLNGRLSDGQIVVNTQSQETVWLILNGVDIHSSNSAPIYIADAKKVVIVLADQTQNTLSDGQSYVFAIPADEEPNAAIFSKSDLTIIGSGALTVNANFRDGISSKDGLIIASGTITVKAADDGIRGKDYLVVKDGSLTVDAKGDGLKSDNTEDATSGYISVAAGTLQVTAGGDAINAQTDVIISGGTFKISSGGGSQNGKGAESTKGIKGTVSVTIDGGTFTIDSADDAIHSGDSVTINGGTFSIATGDDGVHADKSLTVNGGDITVSKSYEGIESAVITLNNGSIHVTASDDGVNGAGGRNGSGTNLSTGGRPGPGGGPGQDAFASTGNYYLYIHGGYLFVDARGDGIDINGAIEMTDGVVVVNGPTQQNNGALDYDAGFNMTGGLIVAAGSSGMAMAPNQGQSSVLVYLASAQPAGTLVHIQNSAGEDLLTFAPTVDYQSVAFSSPALAQGATYTVFTGGSSTGMVTDGLYQAGTYSAGTQLANFTPSNILTTVGSGGRMGPGGGHHP